jgi:hypothetical protein
VVAVSPCSHICVATSSSVCFLTKFSGFHLPLVKHGSDAFIYHCADSMCGHKFLAFYPCLKEMHETGTSSEVVTHRTRFKSLLDSWAPEKNTLKPHYFLNPNSKSQEKDRATLNSEKRCVSLIGTFSKFWHFKKNLGTAIARMQVLVWVGASSFESSAGSGELFSSLFAEAFDCECR